jgi:nitrogen fixation protein FixH
MPTHSIPGGAGGGRKEVTGRMVLICLVAFFAVVAAVNAVMVGAALSTFAGVESESPYQEGLLFDREIAAARAQEARHWRVEAAIERTSDALASIALSARGADGSALTGLTAVVTLVHPTDQRRDRDVQLTQAGPGEFVGTTEAGPGQWDAVVELSRAGERLFRSRNRIVLQ